MQLLEIEALRNRVLEFVGIAGQVHGIEAQDIGEVTLRVTNNIDPERDIQFILGPIDSLDHASRLPNYGSKMGIDATRKWRAEGFERPWSLWLLVFGMYGGLGLASLEALLLIPALKAVWFPLARSDIGYTNMRHTLSAAVLISAIDSLLNSAIILPLLLVIGGMTIWSTQNTEVDVDYGKARASTGMPGWRGSSNPRKKPAAPAGR